MNIMKRIIAGGAACLAVGGGFGCSRLTDPTYEFMTLVAIDGKPLPASITFGPDSVRRAISGGRLGFSNASIGLSCRLELKTPYEPLSSENVSVRGGVNHPRCDTGGKEPLVVDIVLQTGLWFEGALISGTHQFSFAGYVRTKSPEF
jgi:hypothetical protein